MMEYLKINDVIRRKFPSLFVRSKLFLGLKVREENKELEDHKKSIINKIIKKWNLDDLREYPVFRIYRDFFLSLKIDPTKNRPASEALIRRILHNRSFPKINTLVDSYNLASIESCIPFAAFDYNKVVGKIIMREADFGEEFLGIGMNKPIILSGGEVVLQDNEKLMAIYPYRDAEITKISLNTQNVLLITCGAPGIDETQLDEAQKIATYNIQRFCINS